MALGHYRGMMGWVEVVCGSMYSGKTEELIRRLKRAQFAKQKIQVFKPKIDNRYGDDVVASHSQITFDSIPIVKASEILERLDDNTRIVGIDEVQFFDPEVVSICQRLANRGIRVIVAGLDQDYRGEPFGPMPSILAIAEQVTKLNAICVACGNPASRTQKLIHSDNLVEVGAKGMYEARCRMCHTIES